MTPRASTSVCSLLILAATAFSAAAGAQTAPAPGFVAGGELYGLAPAPTADTQQLAVSAGVGETDNVFLSAAPIHSQNEGMLGVDFDLKRHGSVFEVDSDGDFQYVDYLQNAYGKQLYGRFDGVGSLELVPGVLKWVVQDDFGQGQLDPTIPLVPTNLENINVLSTGPDYKLRLGGTGFIDLGLRYALPHYETSPLNGNRELANLAVGDQISAVSAISLNFDYQRLRFDNTIVNTDYDRRELFGRYQLSGARTILDLDLGASQANETSRWPSAAVTPLAQISARRLVSPSIIFTLALAHELTDAADAFAHLRSGPAGGIVVAAVPGTSDSYLSNFASSSLRFERDRTSITVSARWERDTYTRFAAFNDSRAAAGAELVRRLTPVWSLEMQGSWLRIHYFTNGYYETDWPLAAALTMAPGKHTDFKLRVDHVHHSVVGLGNDFTENRVFLIGEYRFWP